MYYIFLVSFLKNLELIYTCDGELTATTMRVCTREGRNAGMADDPVWPDPFRPRIVAPAKGKKSARKSRAARCTGNTRISRYHADYLREIFNPSALSAPTLITYISFYASLKTI